MTEAYASGTVLLPFGLNVCAIGDRVESFNVSIDGAQVMIDVPPSMTEGAVGRSLYRDGWAWWVVDRLIVAVSGRLSELGFEESIDEVDLRATLLDAAQAAVRRLLNAYRWRLHQPQVHAVMLDAAQFAFELVHADGSREALAEPVESFFFHRTPAQPPLTASLNSETHAILQSDLTSAVEPPLDEMIALDIEWLRSIGERPRARELATLCRLPEPTDDGEDYTQP